MAAVNAIVDRAIDGGGGVVNVVGPPGTGKSRMPREAVAMAAGRGVEVVRTFCESHASDIPSAWPTPAVDKGRGTFWQQAGARSGLSDVTTRSPLVPRSKSMHLDVPARRGGVTASLWAEIPARAPEVMSGRRPAEVRPTRVRNERYPDLLSGQTKNSRSRLLMATRRPRHNLGVSGKKLRRRQG